MLDFIKDEDTGHIKKNQISNLYSQTHKAVQIDKYREYLAKTDDLSDDCKNPRNLFDELNSIDSQWLTIARMNLSRLR